MPSGFFFRMKFTTPAMASEPYTADALPVNTSTRSTMPSGMFDTSVKLLRPLNGSGKSAMRRPLTSTSVWFGPSPRRSTCCAPGEKSAPLDDCWLWVSPPFCVIERSSSGTAVKPAAWISFAVMTVIGEGPSIAVRAMRDPVTCTTSRSDGAGSRCGAGPPVPPVVSSVCARAGARRGPSLRTMTTAPVASRRGPKPLPIRR